MNRISNYVAYKRALRVSSALERTRFFRECVNLFL